MHLLLFLHSEDRAQFQNVKFFDLIISAEFLSLEDNLDGQLFDIVSSTMVYRLCREYNPTLSCMVKDVDGQLQYSKQFLKVCRDTIVERDQLLTKVASVLD